MIFSFQAKYFSMFSIYRIKYIERSDRPFTIQQWKVKGDKEQYSYYQNKIVETRKLVDNTSEAMGYTDQQPATSHWPHSYHYRYLVRRY